jgi:hypothetical protein
MFTHHRYLPQFGGRPAGHRAELRQALGLEAAAHTFLNTPANWPAKAISIGAGYKVNAKR